MYPGCLVSKLQADLMLSEFKFLHRLSDKGFDDLLCVLRKLLPNHNELLEKIYLAKQMICPMGLEAKKIYACTNNCILCRRDKYKDLDA